MIYSCSRAYSLSGLLATTVGVRAAPKAFGVGHEWTLVI
jgi:hypothetical protein